MPLTPSPRSLSPGSGRLRGPGDFEPGSVLGHYRLERPLGAGGMGVVYAARDVRDGRPVALKLLRRLDPADIYRFKREFRSLADVHHPNLVGLHELVAVGEEWFFTMELVEGQDLLAHVRAADRSGDARPIAGLTAPAQLERLRRGLRDLARGLGALHAAGKLHRDVKPSNVLVTGEDRVVLLDFGLVADLPERSLDALSEDDIVGTAAYLAPEIGTAGTLSAASDWYSVGVILYEALTGAPPFQGPVLEVLLRKEREEPVPPSRLAEHVPPDLEALCLELLARDPERRPDGAEVIARSGAGDALAEIPSAPGSGPAVAFVGRERHLGELEAAYAQLREGHSVSVYLHGAAGMGKTALAEQFLERCGGALILRGRCFEREAVPYKALDSLVDELARYLRRLPGSRADELLPGGIQALSRLFPVLQRVDAIARRPTRLVAGMEPRELRRRAAAALRELLRRVAAEVPVILYIDDLHWGDVDSAWVLRELMRPPEAPALMLLCCYRSEERLDSACLNELFETESAAPRWRRDVRDLMLGGLGGDDARRLGRSLLGEQATTEQVEAIVRESGGNAFLLTELARHAAGGDGAAALSFDHLVEERTRSLSGPARQLLAIVALAGEPVPRQVALVAAGIDPADERPLATLRALRLVRGQRAGGPERLEIFHDRIRRITSSRLESERHQVSSRLAEAYEQDGGADPEALARLWRDAGDPERALHFARIGGVRAEQALAFDRAAQLYRFALELEAGEPDDHRELRSRLGEALALAGRAAEAARELLAGAAGAPADEALELRRRAAEQLLLSGRTDEAVAALEPVLGAVGLRIPRSSGAALVSLVVRRALVRLRGLRFRERTEAEVSERVLARIDTCRVVGTGFGTIDALTGAAFQTRALQYALRAGEPRRLALALAGEAVFVSTSGARGHRRAGAILRRAEELAARFDDPHPRAYAILASGLIASINGRWREAVDECGRAESLFRDHCAGVSWEISMAQVYSAFALVPMGRFAELATRLPRALTEADERGDLFASTTLRLGYVNLAWLASDDVEGARQAAEVAMQRWSRSGFHLQHYMDVLARCNIEVYAGDAERAYRMVVEAWPALTATPLRQLQTARILVTTLRARAALELAAAGGVGADDAARQLRRLRRERRRWSAPVADLGEAALARRRGEQRRAVALVRAAIDRFAQADMHLYTAAARRRLGEITGGREGEELRRRADAELRACGVDRIDRMLRVLAPGF